MSIEVITNDLLRVNGQFVEISDSRKPDPFDTLTQGENARLQSAYAGELCDSIYTLRHTQGLTTFDPVYVAYQQLPRFVDLARRSAEERAVSYRGFKVGAAVCALDDENLRLGYFFGANYKPAPDSAKYCAELNVRDKVRVAQFNRVVALAVFGPSEFADVDPFPSSTLHPCGVCRDLLETDPLFADNPLIITTNREGERELFMKEDLLALHDS